MNNADRDSLETRVLLLAATVKDAELTRAILVRADIACVTCADQVQMCEQLTVGAGAVLIAEEAVHGGGGSLSEWLGRQPPWSDLPVLVLARAGADSPAVAQAMDAFGHITIVERPARVAPLVSAVRSALRGRRRQYQLRDQLVQRERLAEQLDMATAAAHAGSWQINLTTGEFSASDRAIELHSLPPGTQLNHERALACVHPDDRASVDAALRLTFETGKPYRHEYRVPQPDGSVCWMLSQGQRLGEGSHACIIGLVQDVTERKEVHAELRRRETFISGVLGSITDGFGVVCKDWRFTFANDELVRRIGKQRDEILGNAMWEMFPDAVGNHAYVQLHRAMAERVAVEYEVYYEPWQRWMLEKVFPTADGGLAVYTQDITDRKRDKRGRRLLASIVDNSSDFIGISDTQGNPVYGNRAAMELVGVEDIEQLRRSKIVDYFVPEQRQFVADVVLPAVMKDGRWVGELTFQHFVTGAPIPVLYDLFRVDDSATGQPINFATITRDITDRKRAETALQVSEVHYRRLFESAKDGILILNAHAATITDANPFMAEMLGYSQDEFVGKELWQIGLFKDVEASKAAMRELQEKGYIRYEDLPLETKAGRRINVEFVSNVYGENKEAVIQCNIRDITKRREAERALEKALVYADDIIATLREPFVVLNADLRVKTANRSFYDSFHVSKGETENQFVYDLGNGQWDIPALRALLDRVLSRIEPVHDFEVEHTFPALGRKTMLLNARPFPPDSKHPELILLAVEDVSAVRERADELAAANRRKDEFLATLAHELRNPLAPIRNGLQVMRMAGVTGQVEQVRAMMDRQLTQLVRLVDDLLDVSRVTSGKLELRKQHVELRTVIEAAVETSRPAIEEAGHELAVIVPDEPIFVDGDATRLAQVVSNLLNNSAKYTHRGGYVRLTVGREDATAVVSVKDNGIGIPLTMLGRVFDMFTQVDRTLEKTTGGLGIGLSLVKGLLEMHAGTIEVRSDGEGMGSEFVVRLPVVMSDFAGLERPNGQIREVVPSNLRRILVVDDNVDAADSLGQLLEMLGNEVRTANDGEAAIAMAAQFGPDVVLMDIGMPKLNGYEAARRMRQHPWSRGLVLVALTGWGQEDDRKKSADAGFDHHLIKPVEISALAKLMSDLKCADVPNVGASSAALSGPAPAAVPRV